MGEYIILSNRTEGNPSYLDTQITSNPFYFHNKAINLKIPCDELQMPYCFVLDKDMEVSMSYVIRQNDIELFKEYLEIVAQKKQSND